MREAAALFIQFAALHGWDAAITAVRQRGLASGAATAPSTVGEPSAGGC